MNKPLPNKSQTDWARVRREVKAEAPVPYDPETDPYDPNDEAAVTVYWQKATVITPRRRGPQRAPKKVATALRLSPEVVAFFKAEGRGWQTRIDAALQEYMRQHGKAA